MKGVKLATIAAVLCLAVAAVAGTMTPQEWTTKLSNCPMCKEMAKYPDLVNNIRADIWQTETGFVSTFLVADAKALPMCASWKKDCEATMAKMTPEQMGKDMCPVCQSYGGLMMNKDVKMENFTGNMGDVTVATGKTKEATAALHQHVAIMKEAMPNFGPAFAEMMKTAKPKTAAAGE